MTAAVLILSVVGFLAAQGGVIASHFERFGIGLALLGMAAVCTGAAIYLVRTWPTS